MSFFDTLKTWWTPDPAHSEPVEAPAPAEPEMPPAPSAVAYCLVTTVRYADGTVHVSHRDCGALALPAPVQVKKHVIKQTWHAMEAR